MSKVIFVADMFADELVGGAELSTEALIECAPKELEIIKLKSKDVSRQTIEQYRNEFWVFTNFTRMPYYLMPTIARELNYVIVEYDYKYCWFRSPDLHLRNFGEKCNCDNPMLAGFFKGAKHTFFMSHRQADFYFDMIEPIESSVIGSFFSEQSIRTLIAFRAKPKSEVWAVVYSSSQIKGHHAAIDYCMQKGISYEVLKDLSPLEMLSKLSGLKGLIYKPLGGDTCPRVVIEAQMMGLELDLNEFVEHKDEWPYQTALMTQDHIKKNKNEFWSICNVYNNQKVSV